MGGLPRPYRLANVQASLRLAHVLQGQVPEQRIFLTLHASQARLALGSFLRFSDVSPTSGDAWSEWYDRLGDEFMAGENPVYPRNWMELKEKRRKIRTSLVILTVRPRLLEKQKCPKTERLA